MLKKDKKFYKKRILNLIKNVLTSEDIELPSDLKKNIDIIFNNIIIHFKEIDKAEIIQTEYNTIPINKEVLHDDTFTEEMITDEITSELNKEVIMDVSKICMRKRDNNPLEKFITITKGPQEEPIYPQKKKLKLKTQEFKRKGINKKKNININYDEEKPETPTFEK